MMRTLIVFAIVLVLIVVYRQEISSALGYNFSPLIKSYMPFVGAFAGFVFMFGLSRNLTMSVVVAIVIFLLAGVYSIIIPS